MDTNVTLDAVKFLRTTLKDMKDDVNYAYPKSPGRTVGTFNSNNGHASLQMISSKLETLNNFLDAIEPRKPAVKAE